MRMWMEFNTNLSAGSKFRCKNSRNVCQTQLLYNIFICQGTSIYLFFISNRAGFQILLLGVCNSNSDNFLKYFLILMVKTCISQQIKAQVLLYIIFILIRLINTILKDEGRQGGDIAHFVHGKHISESSSGGPPWIPTLPTRFSYKTRPSHAPSISHRTIPSRFHTSTNLGLI